MKSQWKIQIGEMVECGGKIYKIVELLDLETVLACEVETGKAKSLKRYHLNPYNPKGDSLDFDKLNGADEDNKQEVDFSSIDSKDWDVAEARYKAVKALLSLSHRTAQDVQAKANELGVSKATMYRYIDKYLATEKTSGLLPNVSDGGRGKSRIEENAEIILQETIKEVYLKTQKPKVQKVVREYMRRCYNAGVEAAKEGTVRYRIKQISDREKAYSRLGRRSAARLYDPTPGSFPEGRFPLEVAQIDHTPIDLQFVDDGTRLPIGKLWLTVLIDVFSRLILGFYVSPDAPGITPLGKCLTHAILPKEKELARLDVEGKWNAWGLVNKIHADNAGEFRGYDLRRVCLEYDMDLEWRPVGRPQYGSHIERLLGTFMQEVHLLSGTTFSNVQAKGDYDSEKNAVFTYDEFEKWLTTYIVGVYHKQIHSGTGLPPEVLYERGLLVGTDDFAGTGFPALITDEKKLIIDMLPGVERTVRQSGVVIDKIRYYDSVLNPYIESKNPDRPEKARKFIVKRDPRSIKKIYFYHPDLKQYMDIPYWDLSHPDMTIWEYREVRKKLKADGIKSVSEDDIFKGLNKMREIEDKAIKETKTSRRKAQNHRIYKAQGVEDKSKSVEDSDNSKAVSDRELASQNNKNKTTKTGLDDFYNIPAEDIPIFDIDDI